MKFLATTRAVWPRHFPAGTNKIVMYRIFTLILLLLCIEKQLILVNFQYITYLMY